MRRRDVLAGDGDRIAALVDGRATSILSVMGKVWILDTETKGTGANMVPLERATKRSSAVEPVLIPRQPVPRVQPVPAPRPAPKFRVVDVMTRQVLADDATTRETAAVLRDVRSIVDVNVYVRGSQERWQLLPLADLRALWELARAQALADTAAA
jgi:hypothetical protein